MSCMDLVAGLVSGQGMGEDGEALVAGPTGTDLIGIGVVRFGEVLALVLGAHITNVICAAFLCPYY